MKQRWYISATSNVFSTFTDRTFIKTTISGGSEGGKGQDVNNEAAMVYQRYIEPISIFTDRTFSRTTISGGSEGVKARM